MVEVVERGEGDLSRAGCGIRCPDLDRPEARSPDVFGEVHARSRGSQVLTPKAVTFVDKPTSQRMTLQIRGETAVFQSQCDGEDTL